MGFKHRVCSGDLRKFTVFELNRLVIVYKVLMPKLTHSHAEGMAAGSGEVLCRADEKHAFSFVSRCILKGDCYVYRDYFNVKWCSFLALVCQYLPHSIPFYCIHKSVNLKVLIWRMYKDSCNLSTGLKSLSNCLLFHHTHCRCCSVEWLEVLHTGVCVWSSCS